jgi:hypothetical protein
MFCWDGIPSKRSHGCVPGSFTQASVPIFNELNVGFGLTFANLLLATLHEDHGVLLVNTCEGETGFVTGEWSTLAAQPGPLVSRSVAAVESMVAALPAQLGGLKHTFEALLWHQGEADAGDNQQVPVYHAKYCTYIEELSALVDALRSRFPGASADTPFVNGGLLPYWVKHADGTKDVMRATYALNSSRAHTATADSRIFSETLGDGTTPNADCNFRSDFTDLPIHFNATQAVALGHSYWRAYQQAKKLRAAVSTDETNACLRDAARERETAEVLPSPRSPNKSVCDSILKLVESAPALSNGSAPRPPSSTRRLRALTLILSSDPSSKASLVVTQSTQGPPKADNLRLNPRTGISEAVPAAW